MKLKKITGTWSDLRKSGKLYDGGTIEIHCPALPNFPWTKVVWHDRYYRAQIKGVRWRNGLPTLTLCNIRNYRGRSWISPKPGFEIPTSLKLERKDPLFRVNIRLYKNGRLRFNQPCGSCIVYPREYRLPKYPLRRPSWKQAEKLVERIIHTMGMN